MPVLFQYVQNYRYDYNYWYVGLCQLESSFSGHNTWPPRAHYVRINVTAIRLENGRIGLKPVVWETGAVVSSYK